MHEIPPRGEDQEQLGHRRHLVRELERHPARRLRHGRAARFPHRYDFPPIPDEPRGEPAHQGGLPRSLRAFDDDEQASRATGRRHPSVMIGLAAPCFNPS